jgi:hypothetical protein
VKYRIRASQISGTCHYVVERKHKWSPFWCHVALRIDRDQAEMVVKFLMQPTKEIE